MLFGCGHGDVHHLEEGLREVRLRQPLPRVDEETTHALARHLGHLPADLVCGQAVVPEPEGVEAGGEGVSHGLIFGRDVAGVKRET